MKLNQQIDARIRAWAAARGEEEPRILEPKLSTPNNGGQCVAMFACGESRYIYKPRSCATDRAWAEFMDAIEPVLGLPMPGAVRPLSPFSEEYTIVPCIRSREFHTEEEVISFYKCCGTLLALCMFLGSRDLHGDNLIADDGKPWLIDVELMLSGIVCTKAEKAPDLAHSLLSCHLLPHWSLDSDGDNIDQGGLTAHDHNLPVLWGLPFPPYLYIDAISEAFLDACEAILKNREQLSRELDRFAGVPFRKILRSNNFYRRFQHQLRQIEDEAEKLESSQRLRRAYLNGPPGFDELMRRACDSEIRAVLRDELPVFFSYGNEHCLRDHDGVVADSYFAYSPVEAARLRLNALTWQDCQTQSSILRQSLRATHPEISTAAVSDPMQVFELLESHAVPGIRSSWVGITLNRRGEADFGSIGFSLFEGLAGILAFYAALAEASGSKAVESVLRSRYAPYREAFILEETPFKPRADQLSLTSGLGGQVLSLIYCADCLRDDAFRLDALRLLRRFPFEAFENGAEWDVYNGVSGLLIALPGLMGCGEDAFLHGVATRLAELIRHADAQTCGFGRGAAGLALALAAAQHICGADYEEDILRLLEWESSLYQEEAGNWPAAEVSDQHLPGHGLCDGAPGIGIARLQLMEYTDNPRVLEICERDLARVRAFLCRPLTLPRDGFCCGNAARVEAERLLLGSVENSALNPGPAFYHPLDTDDFPAGLFLGWAGAGYALVRSLPGSRHSLFFSGARPAASKRYQKTL